MSSFNEQQQKNMKTHRQLRAKYINELDFDCYFENELVRNKYHINESIKMINELNNIKITGPRYESDALFDIILMPENLNYMRKNINNFVVSGTELGAYYIIQNFTDAIKTLIQMEKQNEKLIYNYQCYYNLTQEQYLNRVETNEYKHHNAVINNDQDIENIIYKYSNHKFISIPERNFSIEQHNLPNTDSDLTEQELEDLLS